MGTCPLQLFMVMRVLKHSKMHATFTSIVHEDNFLLECFDVASASSIHPTDFPCVHQYHIAFTIEI
jgi:hypothetical protein